MSVVANWYALKNYIAIENVINYKFIMIIKNILAKQIKINLDCCCTLNCIFCSNKPRYKKIKELEKIKSVLDKIKITSNIENIYWTGCEPLNYHELPELLEYAKQLNFHNTVFTHGLNLNEDYLSLLKLKGLDELCISIQGIDYIHNIQTGSPAAWDELIHTLSIVIDSQIPISTNTIITKYNYGILERISNLFLKLNASTHNFICYNFYNESGIKYNEFAVPHYFIQYKYIKSFLENSIEILRNRKVNIFFMPYCMLEKKYYENIVGFKQLFLNQNNFLPQKICLSQKYIEMDDLHKLNYLLKSGKKLSEYFNDNNLKECQKCSLQFICDGLNKKYISKFGAAELKSVSLEKYITDMNFFRTQQRDNNSDFTDDSNFEKNYINDLNTFILNLICNTINLYFSSNFDELKKFFLKFKKDYTASHISILAQGFINLLENNISNARAYFKKFDIIDNHQTSLGEFGIILSLKQQNKLSQFKEHAEIFKHKNFTDNYEMLNKLKSFI